MSENLGLQRMFLFLLVISIALNLGLFIAVFITQGSLRASNERISLLEANVSVLEQSLSSARQETAIMRGMLDTKESELGSANQEISRLNSLSSSLQGELASTKGELAASQTNLEAQRGQVQELFSEINSVQKNLSDSMSWFKENSRLPYGYSFSSDILKTRVMEDCVDAGELNLACISYRMESTALSMRYRTDITWGQEDHLQSITETFDKEGGDCEDWSLFVKAVLNYAKTQANLTVRSFEYSSGSNFRVYPAESKLPFGTHWAVPDARPKNLGPIGYPVVVCYNNGNSGHCTIALAQRQIKSTKDIQNLVGAQIFEPQNGQSLGSVGQEFSICNPIRELCQSELNKIFLVISDEDLYQVYGGRWASYADYKAELEAVKKKLAT